MNLDTELAAVQSANRKLIQLDEENVNAILHALADAAEAPEHVQTILEANKKDLARMETNDPKYDRLKLTEERLRTIANDIRNVAQLPFPLNIILEERDLPSGLHLQKTTVPIGVIGVIYEARPNVTFDVFALCFKSGNACVLKGGSDAKDSNAAITYLIHTVLQKHGIDTKVCYLAPPEREAVEAILNADKYIDLVIPRGSQNLINFVREHAKMPTIETGAGIVHIYVDEGADTIMARDIIENSKVKRPSVCNAVDCILMNKMKIPDIREICAPLAKHKVIIHADIMSHQALKGYYP
ncbi:glutamate-5-semialdehyde dehydrogenase, partial [Candidatus Peregrinibacteria bacterium CG11_big_fil_rev_8_21_14_0_20_46_8]